MKKLYFILMQTLICALLSIYASAQITDTVSISPPADIAACRQDTFTASFAVNSVYVMNLSIHDSLNYNGNFYPSTCDSGGSSHITSLHILTSTIPLTLTYDSLTSAWTTGNFTYNGIITITYTTWIDCGVLHLINDTSSAPVFFVQQWSDVNNNYSFYFPSTGNNSYSSSNILTPFFVDITDQLFPNRKFYSSYHKTDTIYFLYQNNGSADGNIRFSFDPDAPTNCGKDSTILLKYAVGDTSNINSVSYTNFSAGTPQSAFIPVAQSLIIKQIVYIQGCLDSCKNEKAIFNWRCNYADSLSSFPLCDACYQGLHPVYSLNLDSAAFLTLKRIAPNGMGVNDPNDTAYWDHTCMGGSVNWEYHLVNNGHQAIPYAMLELTDNSNSQGYNFLTLIDSTSIHITPHCTNCFYSDSMTLMNASSCNLTVTKPLRRLRIYIYDLGKNDSLTLRFSTFRCCEENDFTLLNVGKYFNKWQLLANAHDACQRPVTINPTNSYSGSAGGISSNWQNSGPNLNLDLDFTPTVSDLNSPPLAFGDTSALLYVDFKKLVSGYDYQILGCSGTPGICSYNGYLRVRIQCDTGLVVFAPHDSVRITKTGSNLVWYPSYYYSDVPYGICRDGNYYFYFNLSDSIADSLINNSHVEFYLQSCCDAPAQSFYTVAFHLLVNPSGACDTLFFPPGDTLPPACIYGHCCFLPLNSVGSFINDHCPGCLSTGIQSDNYSLFRTNLGFKDGNNNMKADTAVTAIDSTYLSANGSFMKPYLANHGDFLEDRLLSHLQEGDPTSGGYTLTQLNDSSVYLNVMQLYRSATPTDSLTDIGLTPYYMKLYIDAPDSTAAPGDCKDCNDFTSVINGFRTQRVIEADTLDSLSFYLTTDYANFRYLFTFDARNDSSLFHNMIYNDPGNSFATTGFFENQRYRLKVKYGIRKFFSPPSTVVQAIADQRKEVNITNYMFLSGRVHPIDSIHGVLPEMPNDTSGLPHPLTQSFGDNHAFICAPQGGRFYFYCDEVFSQGGYRNQTGNRCHRYMEAIAVMRTGGNNPAAEKYPYEFRLPAFKPYKWQFHVPPGYQADTIGQVKSIFGANISSVHTFTVPLPVADTITIYDSLFTRFCLSDTMGYTGASLYNADHFSTFNIRINLYPAYCNPDSIYVRKPNDIVTWFTDNNRDCNGVFTPFSRDTIIRQTEVINDTLKTPQPLLTFLPSSAIQVSTAHVCWDFDFYVDNDDAYYVFIAPLQTGYFANWTVSVNGGTPVPIDSNNVIGLDSIFHPSPQPYSCHVCADYVNCDSLPYDSVPFFYGWNCGAFPTDPFPDTSLCFNQQSSLYYSDPGYLRKLGTTVYPDSFDLCEPFHLSQGFISALGSLYPYQVTLDSMNTFLMPQAVYLLSCDSLDTVQLQQTGIYTWSITAAELALIQEPDSAISGGDCLWIDIKLEHTCEIEGVSSIHLPDIILNTLSYCGDSVNFPATLHNTAIPYSGESNCKDCFTLTKTASQDTVSAGDTTSFNIIICGNNDSAYVVSIIELLPTGFIPTSTIPATDTIPAQGCDTITVFGYFDSTGTCSSLINTVQIITQSNDTLTADTCITVIPPVSPCFAQTNIQIPNGTFSSIYGSALYGDSILVLDTFYIDNTFSLYNCKVYTETGAQIIVMQGDTLILNNSVISGCTNMWRGIFLDTNAVYYQQRDSYIYDADWGVYASENSKFFIHGRAGILDCVRGIFVPPNGSGGLNNTYGEVEATKFGLYSAAFKPDYPGQAQHGILPYAGMDLNDMIMTIGKDSALQNEFYHLNNGVIGRRSRIVINNSEFSRVKTDTFYADPFRGTAMVSVGKHGSVKGSLTVNPVVSGLPTVFNSHRGVYTDYSYLRVSGTDFINMNIGIYSTWCTDQMTSYVGNCTIEAEKFGIKWEYNTGTGGMGAEYNTITVRTAYAKGIYMSETNNTNPVNYLAYGNRIVTDSATFAVVARNVSKPTISFNIITINGYSQALTKTEGISLRYCDNASVTCNTIVGEYPLSIDTTIRAIGTHISTHSFIACNSIDSTYHGALFGGICIGTQFKGNSIHNHFDGLYLNKVAVIDTQSHTGNHWYGIYASGYGAVNRNDSTPQNLFASIFIVDPSDTTLTPNIPLNDTLPPYYVNDQGWFDYQVGGNTFECSTPTYNVCGNDARDDGGSSDDLRIMIARDNTITSDYIPESKIIAKQFLFADLKADPVLLASDTVFQNFVSANHTTSVGYLYEAKKYLQESLEYDSSFASFLSVTDSLIQIHTDSISYIDSLAAVDSTLDFSIPRQAMINQIQVHQQAMEDSLAGRNDFVEANLDAAESNNALVQSFGSPDENERLINEMEILLQRVSIGGLFVYYNEILAVAQQCPYSGGAAVFRARAMIEMMDIEIDYDDETVCSDLGIYRQGSVSDKTENENIQIIPNPASDKVLILLSGGQEGICKIEITNILGSVILKDEMNCKEKSHSINTRNFTAGVYFVKVHINNSLLKIAKLIIER